MQTTIVAPVGIGWVIAIVALLIDIVLMVIGQMEIKTGMLIAAALLARILA